MGVNVAERPVLKRVLTKLKKHGYQPAFLESAVPDIWTAGAEGDPGGLAHAKLVFARSLGLEISAFMSREEIEPVSIDGMRFKRSSNAQSEVPPDQNLAYFARLVRSVASGMHASLSIPSDPFEFHDDVSRLSGNHRVDLESLIGYCWTKNIAVIHVENIPAKKKGLDALVYRYNGRFVVVIARRIGPEAIARAAFILAHELGHIALGHVDENTALIDDSDEDDRQLAHEPAADAFAAALLASDRYDDSWHAGVRSPLSLAVRAIAFSESARLNAGQVLMRFAFENDAYIVVGRALHLVPHKKSTARQIINTVAVRSIDFSMTTRESEKALNRTITA